MNNDIYLYDRILGKREDYNMWFVFPGPESFALSSLGYMWLFKAIDSEEGINVERVYDDLKTTDIMFSDVNLIAFSISFDFDYLSILEFFKKYNIPFLSNDRGEDYPLIYAGGPVITSNPEPYKNFFDFFVIGDGEDVNTEAINLCIKNKNLSKNEKLKMLSEIRGIYVPKFSKPVLKATKKLSECIYTPVISENSFFKNTFIVEVERGCANRCGFCLASYINLPIRFVPYEEIIYAIDLGLKYTNKLALLGAQVTAHPDFEKICRYIHSKIKGGENIELGVSSLRVDSFKKEIVQTLVDAGQKNLTLAIEAGSERLRKLINKNLSEKQIFEALDVAVDCGLKGIKFYGMLGLPTETVEDIQEIINLASKIKSKYKGFDVSFGFSTFVPKAHTPFQWFGREDEKSLEKKSNFLKKELHKLGIQSTVTSPKWDYYQAVLSRGDSKLTEFLIKVYEYGGKLGAYRRAAKDLNLNLDYYATENYSYDKELPWDFIEMTPGKEFLIKESKRLLEG